MAPHIRPKHAPAISSAILAVLLYAVTLGGTWIYDDPGVAKEDPRLHDPRQWVDFLTQGYSPGATDHLWRPLTNFSFALQWQLHGEKPWAMHLVNILIYAAVCVMVTRLAERLAGAAAAWAAGLLFAAHPLHVEAVAYLVGRAETLCALGVVGGLLLFLKPPPMTRTRALAILGCFLFASLAKEHGLLLPAMLLLFSQLQATPPVGSLPENARQSHRNAMRLLAAMLTITLAAYISYRDSILPWYWETGFLDSTINPLVLSRGLDRWLIPVAILGRYACIFLLPLKPSLDYGVAVFTPRVRDVLPFFYAGLAALAFLATAVALAWRRRARITLALLGCAAISYFLIANILMIGTIFGERLLFLSSVFLCILAGMAIARLPRPGGIALLVILAVMAGLRTVTYAVRWNDSLAFYAESSRQQPRSAQFYLLHAWDLRTRGRLDESWNVLREGREKVPEGWRLWAFSADLALQMNRLDDAEQFALTGMNVPGADRPTMEYYRQQVSAKREPPHPDHP